LNFKADKIHDMNTYHRAMMRGWKYLACLVSVFAVVGCGSEAGNSNPGKAEKNKEQTYSNPVFSPVLADPSIVEHEGYFYAYGTENNWGSEGGYHLVPIVRSRDLVNWTFVNDAFTTKPDWKQEGNIWAPDVTEVDGRYFMYYSMSTWGDPNPGIGLAVAESPAGPFTDQGKVFFSKEVGVDNSIDPFFIEEDDNKYLFWGSFHGIYAVQLTDDGKEVKGEKTRIADTHLEASYVYKKDGYYYFFGSEGSCCEGANSTYHVKVGRAESLLGPYLDKEGNDFASGHYGELLLKGNEGDTGFAGPGHNAEIITDDEGTEWFLYHAINKSNDLLDDGKSRRPLMLDKISWEEGWPYIEGQQPTTQPKTTPVFNH
jgi:arabinan endo-1,5-alpha-L-arabinosidase